MTTIDTPVPTHRLDAADAAARVGRVLLAGVALLLYVVGWLPARALVWGRLAASWSVAAVRLGWREGRAGGARGET